MPSHSADPPENRSCMTSNKRKRGIGKKRGTVCLTDKGYAVIEHREVNYCSVIYLRGKTCPICIKKCNPNVLCRPHKVHVRKAKNYKGAIPDDLKTDYSRAMSFLNGGPARLPETKPINCVERLKKMKTRHTALTQKLVDEHRAEIRKLEQKHYDTTLLLLESRNQVQALQNKNSSLEIQVSRLATHVTNCEKLIVKLRASGRAV